SALAERRPAYASRCSIFPRSLPLLGSRNLLTGSSSFNRLAANCPCDSEPTASALSRRRTGSMVASTRNEMPSANRKTVAPVASRKNACCVSLLTDNDWKKPRIVSMASQVDTNDFAHPEHRHDHHHDGEYQHLLARG